MNLNFLFSILNFKYKITGQEISELISNACCQLTRDQLRHEHQMIKSALPCFASKTPLVIYRERLTA